MTLRIDQDVLRFQISIRNLLCLVEKLQNQTYFGCVELGCRLVESSRASQVAENFAARAVVELQLSVYDLLRALIDLRLTSMYRESGS